MTASYFSFRVQKIIEYIKNVGCLLETNEVKNLGVQVVLQEEYGICAPLTKEEASLLQQEMLTLAEWNKIREAGLKLWEIHTIDSGVMPWNGWASSTVIGGRLGPECVLAA